MSRAAFDPDDPAAAPAFVLEATYEATDGVWHSHRHAQLVHASAGVLVVTTSTGRWVAPPQRAVWVPAGMAHSVASRRPFQLLTLYVDPAAAPTPECCQVVAVDTLVGALLKAGASFGAAYPPTGPEQRLLQVVLDRLPALAAAPVLQLPQPRSPALVQVAAQLLARPDDQRTLEQWAASVAMTPKTFARRCVAETGMTFGRWRQHLRLLVAVELLGGGDSVTAVAFDVGYEDVSSFISAFKSVFSHTPAQYFR
jgi:AraC-like DNA-binding protein